MRRALATVALSLLTMAACSAAPSTPADSSSPAGSSAPSVPSAGSQTGGSSRTTATGQIPRSCDSVTIPALLESLSVNPRPVQAYTEPSKASPMPTSEEQAQEESRTWPGLSCLYKTASEDEEALVLVMPDSAWFTHRQTSSCMPTYGKGSAVTVGSTKGWYCPTTNETPGEWVSFAQHGLLVTVMRVSQPTGGSPYRDALVAYATALSQRL